MTESAFVVARVIPMVTPPQLDKDFDYSIPEELQGNVKKGMRVQVRFAGQRVTAIVRSLHYFSDFSGTLSPIIKTLGGEVIIQEPMLELVEKLAQYYAGTRRDILRSAIPDRVAAAEKAGLLYGGKSWEDLAQDGQDTQVGTYRQSMLLRAEQGWEKYAFSTSFIHAVCSEHYAAASWLYTPGEARYERIAEMTAAVAWSGLSVLIIAPHQRAVDAQIKALESFLSADQIMEYSSQLGAQTRYRRFLSMMHGQARVVVGTRSAVFSPLQKMGLIIVIDEADDGLVDPIAPYMHVRRIAWERAKKEQCGVVFSAATRSSELQLLVENNELPSLLSPRENISHAIPEIYGVGKTDFSREKEATVAGSRLPRAAFDTIRAALERDMPALVVVPRAGHAPSLACGRCKTSARCRWCNGPLEYPRGTNFSSPVPQCKWCGRREEHFVCPECGDTHVRVTSHGDERTAEELGRAFPGIQIITSAGKHVKDSVPQKASIIVSTPGAEPLVEDLSGASSLYGSAVLMDPWVQLNQSDLRAQEKTYRRWAEAIAKVQSHSDGGQVFVNAEHTLPIVEALVHWLPVEFAHHELSGRREAHFPPAWQMVAVDGTAEAIEELIENFEPMLDTEFLGPVQLPPDVPPPGRTTPHDRTATQRMLVRAPHENGPGLKLAIAQRATKRENLPLRVIVDPVRIG